ncbi:hypothetical protein AB1L88_08160 [Tautonia sp. JC769]|uniref:hypothetical protein n=1 Tax=Tautonia sp. JC769 TaxID=3232135 RepID=UPI00345747D5
MLDDPRHVHVQALRGEGIAGRLIVDACDGVETLWSAIAGRRPATVADLGDESGFRAGIEGFRARLRDHDRGDAAIVVRWPDSSGKGAEDGAIDPWLARIDEVLHQAVELLLDRGEEVTILVVVLDRPSEADASERDDWGGGGGFVMTSSRGLPAGEIPDAVRLIDLAATLLKLAGRPIPEQLGGAPIALETLVSRVENDERAVLERLRGLGYLS